MHQNDAQQDTRLFDCRIGNTNLFNLVHVAAIAWNSEMAENPVQSEVAPCEHVFLTGPYPPQPSNRCSRCGLTRMECELKTDRIWEAVMNCAAS